jgi:hypothetical protein
MRSTRLSCITAAIIIAVASFVPAASHAAQVTLRAFNASGALIATCGPVGSSSAATSGTVTLPSTCGPFQISPYVSTPQLAGLAQSSGNQVVVRNAVIRNAGTATARLQIDGFHTFILPSGVTVFQNRFYGIGLSATFNRLNGTVLASGDKIVKKGYYAYFIGQTQSREDQIGGTATGGVTLSYTVPSTGSLTTNAVPIPSPSAREPTSPDTRRCINLVSTNNCTSNLERLRTVVDVTIAAGDKVTIPNGDHTIAAGSQADVDTILDSLSAQVLLQQNTPSTTINPFDNGYLTVYLICNEHFRCEYVDTRTLTFGPGEARPVSTSLKDVAGYNDSIEPIVTDNGDGTFDIDFHPGEVLAKDGIKDLVLKFRMQQTGITCESTGATLTGEANFPADPLANPPFPGLNLDFHATASVAAAPQQCPQ